MEPARQAVLELLLDGGYQRQVIARDLSAIESISFTCVEAAAPRAAAASLDRV